MLLTLLNLGILSFTLSYKLILFLMKRMPLNGRDYHKKDKRVLPEAIGLATALSFITTLFIYLLFNQLDHTFNEFLALSSSSIFTVLLGLIDDLLDLEWRYKLIFPAISMIPTALLYSEGTKVIIPFLGLIDLGIFYYIYMMICCTFATNAINILSGINGLEVIQVIILSSFTFIDHLIRQDRLGTISAFLLICASLPLYYFNKYPARVFVGDNFCYFSGMVLSCVAILTHTTRTMFLFMGIQIINFVISLPQLFKVINCPRHRMPDMSGQYLVYSKVKFRKYEVCNLTVPNLILYLMGPMREKDLCEFIAYLQVVWCGIVFICKYLIYSKYM